MTLREVKEKLEVVNYLLAQKDIDTLYKYAKKVPDGGTIVDIGTAAGGSAFTMALASKPSVKVYTIDPQINQTFVDRVSEWGLWDKITYYIETSKDAVKHFKEIDLLFVDGIHSYQGVSDDFRDYNGFVKKGGIIIFHDYYLYGNTIGAAVDDIVKSGDVKKIEIADDLYQDKRIGMFVSEKL